MIKNIVNIVWDSRFIHYFGITGIGFLINLVTIFILTEFVLGNENYIYSYFIGSFLNLVWNFIFNLSFVFRVKSKVILRLVRFFSYHISMTLLQAFVIKNLVDFIGIKFYLFGIVFVIGSFFVLGFLVSKYFIFKSKNKIEVRK